MMNPMNVASPLSPLNPLNPLNPASPLNPLNQSSSEETRDYHDPTLGFQEDLQLISKDSAASWLKGTAEATVDQPGVGSLRRTAEGFAMHVTRSGLFGPIETLDYLYDRKSQKVEVNEQSLRGPVRQFLSMAPQHEEYILDLKTHTRHTQK